MNLIVPGKPVHQFLCKLLLLMKLSTILILATALHVSAAGYSQKVSISEKKIGLNQVFKLISRQTGYEFLFSEKLLNQARPVTIEAKDASVTEVLNQCLLNNQELAYTIKNNIIIIRRAKEQAPVNEPVPSAIMPEPPAQVAGRVTDPKGNALPGVTITIIGKPGGTVTNDLGEFIIQAEETDTLSFSFIGFKTQKVAVGSRKTLQVRLEEASNALNDVVVVGYGTQRRRDITGSVASVDFKKVENIPNVNISQALAGSVAGVSVTPATRPGQTGKIYIRGISSITASSDPLIVLDGIIYPATLADIPAADIASLEILKDASATAIYGSRAANGVILITTKRGTSAKPAFQLSSYYGTSDYTRRMDMLTPEQFLQKAVDVKRSQDYYRNDSYVWDTEKYTLDNIASQLSVDEREMLEAGKTIDPQDVIKQDPRMYNVELSVSQRTEKFNYYLSGALVNQKGLIKNDNFQRINLKANLEAKLSDWLTIGLNSGAITRDQSGMPANTVNMMWLTPYGKIYNDDGSIRIYPASPKTSVSNPLQPLLNKHSAIARIFTNTVYGRVDFPFLKGLSYTIRYGSTLSFADTKTFVYPEGGSGNVNGSASRVESNINQGLVENQLNYKTVFGAASEHRLDVTALASQETETRTNQTSGATGFFNTGLDYGQFGIGQIPTISNISNKRVNQGAMLRVNYGWKDKYMLTLTGRRDGYSGFGANRKYGYFPSGALAWIASEENFLKNVQMLDFLKVRLSYGTVGTQGVDPYTTLARMDRGNYVFGDGGTTAITIYPATMPNADLGWESTTESDLGADFTLWKNKLSGTVDVYRRKTKDLLLSRQLHGPNGFSQVMVNLGGTQNDGFELTLNYNVIDRKNFGWSVNGNFSSNRNRITHLYGNKDEKGNEISDIGNRWFIGKDLSVVYDYEVAGVWQEGDDIPAGHKAKPGYQRLVDQNGDGAITPADMVFLGQAEPKWRAGLRNELRYKDFTFSVFVNTTQGSIADNKILDFTYMQAGGDVSFNMIYSDGWWTPENKNNKRPALTSPNAVTYGNYQKTSFVRIQDISLAYKVPAPMLEKLKLGGLSFYVSAKNPFMFTKWSGWDPEGLSTVTRTYYRSQVRGGYPMIRSFIAGLNLNF